MSDTYDDLEHAIGEDVAVTTNEMRHRHNALAERLHEVKRERDEAVARVKGLEADQGMAVEALEEMACPITGFPFFAVVNHQDDAVATFGGPYDSYTMAQLGMDGDYERQRFCHDRGIWMEWENLCVFVITENEWCELVEALGDGSPAAKIASEWLDQHVAAKAVKKRDDGGSEVMRIVKREKESP